MDIAQFKNRKQSQTEETVKIPITKKISRHRLFKILKPLIPILLLILTITILTWLGVFKIKTIQHIKNLQYVTNWDIATNPYLGQGYFSLNLENLKDDIKKINGYVKEIQAQKIFPNKIDLKIEEYIPKYYLEYKETCYIFSQEGIVLEQKNDYIECNLENGIQLLSNQNIIADNRLIYDTEISKTVKILEEFTLNISKINIEEDVLRFSDDKREIILESVSDFDAQLSKLYLVLEKVNLERIEYSSLDMRFQRPVMELK
jgi:cell division septal protein FtsQ